ncbi:MAG: FkbM family methyltransferase [Bryobacterales bacterium]|nr:FkbM family methyltransferase [Bryobacterales bacterium]
MTGFEVVSLINGVRLHVPASFARILPVSPCETDFPYEIHSWVALEAIVEAGEVVYDAGASYGIFSVMLARAGAEVHAFEANPDVLERQRELVESNGLRVTTVPVCVGERSGGEVEFYRAPGLASVASSRHAVVKRMHGEASMVRVPLLALDDYAASKGHVPGCLKIDVEGSEWMALEGARRLIETARPDIVMETHPRQMIGATLGDLCGRLERWGYPLFDLVGGQMMEGAEFARAYAALPGYVLASSRLAEREFVGGLSRRHEAMKRRWAVREGQAETIRQAKKLMDGGAASAIPLLEQVVANCPDHAEGHYLLGFCLHVGKREVEGALAHYEQALRHGFDPFWVEYHIGALLYESGRREEAGGHLKRARALDPRHEGTKALVEQLGV